MTEHNPNDLDTDREPASETAELKSPRRLRIAPVWLIPLAALLIGLWLLYQNVVSQGPSITLKIDNAEGISAGSTQVKVHSVPVGHVTDIRLADDYQGAILSVQMDPGSAPLLKTDSRFWVVKPRVGPRGVSGLNTIISGAYIELRPGQSHNDKRRFTMLETAPPVAANQPGVDIKLVSQGDNTLAVGDPVVFQGQNVGTIDSADFSIQRKQMVYGIFVRRPYARLITQATQFWLRSGVDFHLGSNGVDVQIGSIQSVLAGGVTFGLPPGVKPKSPARDGDQFKLYETRNDAIQDRYHDKVRYVVLLNDTVRGLSPGAPVEYRGLRVGTVERVPFYARDYSPLQFSNIKIPVLIAFEPQRPSLSWEHFTDQRLRTFQRKLFAHGLRATIKTSNLLTGSTFVDLIFDRNAKPFKAKTIGQYPIFPSEPSQFTSIQQQLSNLMDKLNALDIKPIANQLKHAITTSSQTLDQLKKTTTEINTLLGKAGTQNLPDQLSDTLQQLQKTLDNFQSGAPAYRKLNQSMDRLNQVLDNVAPLSRTLREHPNALIFGHNNGPDPVPKAHR